VDVVAANLSENESASASPKHLLSTGFLSFCLFAIAAVNFYGTGLGPAYAAVAVGWAVLLSAPAFFQALTVARVVIEVGTHSAWVQDVITECGHEVLAANRSGPAANPISNHCWTSLKRPGF
jgi:hypothetical protein